MVAVSRLLLIGVLLCSPTAAAEHPWRAFVADRAASDVSGDFGQWDALLYRWTGKPEHAQAAIKQGLANWPTIYDERGNLVRNNSREHAAEMSQHFELLEPQMMPDQRAAWESKLKTWGTEILANTRDGDVDEVAGHYLGLRLIDRAIGTDYCQRPPIRPSASAAEMREAIRRFMPLARGGEWIEGGQKYNYGTLSVHLNGVIAIGPEEFPEVLAWLPELAEQMTWHVTVDGKDTVQWGDVEDPHRAELYQFVTLASQVIALGGDKTGNLTHLLAARIQGRPVRDYGFTIYRAFWAGFDPTLLPAVPRWVDPQGFRTTNVGLTLHRSRGALAEFFLPNEIGISDHRIDGTNLRLYHGGDWLVGSALGYGNARPLNQALGFGFGAMHARKVVAAEQTADGCRVVWQTGGDLRGEWAGNNQPPHFVESMTTEVRYTRETLLFQITDTFRGKLPDFEIIGGPALTDAERETILGSSARWQRVQHMPTEPTPTADGYTWRSKGGTIMELKTTAPKRMKEKCSGVNMRGTFDPAELEGWLVRLMTDDLPTARIETTIGPKLVGPPPDQPPPVEPPTAPVPVEPSKVFRAGNVEYRLFPNRLERHTIEVFPLAP